MNLSTYQLEEEDYEEIERKIRDLFEEIYYDIKWNIMDEMDDATDESDLKVEMMEKSVNRTLEKLEEIKSLQAKRDEGYDRPEWTEEQKNHYLGRE